MSSDVTTDQCQTNSVKRPPVTKDKTLDVPMSDIDLALGGVWMMTNVAAEIQCSPSQHMVQQECCWHCSCAPHCDMADCSHVVATVPLWLGGSDCRVP